MQTFHAETVIEKNGQLHLDDLPFSKGEKVHVFVSHTSAASDGSLKGTVLKFEQPLAPVAEEDWEAVK